MNGLQDIKDVQKKILEIMKYIDSLCRENNITYYIMGGTALGAVRHRGFIPWDDDLDIFMTPEQYTRFKTVFEENKDSDFVLQEWRTTDKYLEYAKVRMNGTTFIEEAFKDCDNLHQGIYVDIMILHKVPTSKVIQRIVYYESKFVTLYALSQRNWEPKTKIQKIVLKTLNFMPCKLLTRLCYKHIYRYDSMTAGYRYCYWITPAKFRSGLFEASFFEEPIDIVFEDTKLLASKEIVKYLEYRYGNYMELPSEKEQKAAVHAVLYDTEKDYREYIK